MNRYLFILCYLCYLWVLSSCAQGLRSKKKRPPRLPIFAAQVPEAWAIKALVTYETSDKSLQGLLNLRIRRDSLIWASISPGIGIELGRGIATQKDIQAINRFTGQYFQYSYDSIAHTWGIPLGYAWLERILFGQPLLDAQAYTILPSSKNNSSLHLQAHIPPLIINTWLEQETQVTQMQRIIHPAGYHMELQYTYEPLLQPMPKELRSIRLPSQLHIKLLGQGAAQEETWQLRLSYQKINILSPSSTHFPFKVPKRYEK